MKKRKWLSVLLTLCMIFSVCPSYAATSSDTADTRMHTSSFSDIEGHWASKAINKWAGLDVIEGDDKGFRPNDSITRAEMAVILDNLMDYQKKAENKFTDVSGSSWYADAVLKANESGILKGNGAGRAFPNEKITREEAAAMLARSFGVDEVADYKTSFKDDAYISSWAKALVFGMEEDKYIGGMGNGNFEPKTNITRAQVVTIIDNAVKAYYTKAGTYKDDVSPSASGSNCVTIVKSDGVVIKDATIYGDLIVSEGVDTGNFTLDNSIITGKLIARGGGEDSIHIINGASVNGKVSVERVDGAVRIVSDGVVIANLDANTEVILEGDFTNVVVAEGAVVEVRGQVASIQVEAKAKVVITKEATVGTFTVAKDAEGSKIEISGTLDSFKTEASGTDIIATETAKITTIKATSTAEETNINIDKKAIVKTIDSDASITTSGSGSAQSVTGTGTVSPQESGSLPPTISAGGGGGGALPQQTVPEAPTSVTASVDDDIAVVSFSAPLNNGGSAITGFTVKVYQDGVLQPDLSVQGSNSPISISGLIEGLSYTFSVIATNSIGNSAESVISNQITIEETSGRFINGTISLPNDETAPVGGIDVNLFVYDSSSANNNISGSFIYSSSVNIAENQTSANYRIAVAEGSYKLGYRADSNSYVKDGYYNSAGTGVDWESSTVFNVDSTDVTGIDMDLIKGQEIRGTVNLPNGEVASIGGVHIDVYAWRDYYDYSTTLIIPEGLNAATYAIRVPEGSYKLRYHTESINYVERGFHTNSVTAFNPEEAAMVVVSSSDVIGIDMTLIKGTAITGTISLPNSEVAPAGGIRVYLNTSSSPFISLSIDIPQGQNNAGYTVRVPEGSYIFDYYTDSMSYVNRGWYSSEGTTQYQDSATPVIVDATDINGIDIEIIKGRLINGTISLPNGEIAPLGGLEVYIAAASTYSGYSTRVIIPAGQNATSYSLRVPEGTCIVQYLLDSQNTDYIQKGYYGENQTVTESDSSSNLNIGLEDINGIDLTILKGFAVSGRISLPDGEVAPVGGIVISLDFINSETYSSDWYSAVVIPEGENSVDYTKRVNEGSYTISYYINNHHNTNYMDIVWYSSAGETLHDWLASSITITSSDVSGIDVILIKGQNLSGYVSLPNGDIASSGGIDVQIYSSDSNGGRYSTNVTIPEDQNSLEYKVKVPEGSYKIEYNTGNSSYVNRGWYSSTGSTANEHLADSIEVASSDISGLDIALLEGKAIRGTISLPNGETAPNGGIRVDIYVSSNSFIDIMIPEGQNSATYKVTVPEGSYTLGYFSNNPNYVNRGWYNSGGTTQYQNFATPVVVDAADVNGINMTLIKGHLISGTISLPDEDAAGAGGIVVTIDIDILYSKNITIQEGQNSANYSVMVPEGNYAIRYSTNSPKYVFYGYYGNSVTTPDPDATTLVTVESSDVSGIDMTLIKGQTISGLIALPNGETAPVGGINVAIYVSGYNFTQSVSVTIPDGQNSAAYIIRVGEGDYRLQYSISDSDFIRLGWYRSTGTTANGNLASIISVSSSDVNGINITVLKDEITQGIGVINSAFLTVDENGDIVQRLDLYNDGIINSRLTNATDTISMPLDFSTPALYRFYFDPEGIIISAEEIGASDQNVPLVSYGIVTDTTRINENIIQIDDVWYVIDTEPIVYLLSSTEEEYRASVPNSVNIGDRLALWDLNNDADADILIYGAI